MSPPRPVAEALAAFAARPSEAAVVLDFDGTLAPIVADPADARPGEGVVDVLADLVPRFGLVAVVSGRPVDFLGPLLPAGIAVSGLYGLEVLRDGRRTDLPRAGVWREVVADVARASVDRGPAGMRVESKGLSLTLHYREHPEAADAVASWAELAAARSGLVARPAKMSVELHPPVAADKGTALEALVGDLAAVLYAGDDRGDLPAYDALDRLAARGARTLRVAVSGPEVPAELVARAQLVVDGPAALVELLRGLVQPAAAS